MFAKMYHVHFGVLPAFKSDIQTQYIWGCDISAWTTTPSSNSDVGRSGNRISCNFAKGRGCHVFVMHTLTLFSWTVPHYMFGFLRARTSLAAPFWPQIKNPWINFRPGINKELPFSTRRYLVARSDVFQCSSTYFLNVLWGNFGSCFQNIWHTNTIYLPPYLCHEYNPVE